MNPSSTDPLSLDRRFDRIGRLVGDDGMHRLQQAHVMVVGIGGVGSWAAEALVRSGVGAITMVDFDHVCITNFNRQIPAVDGTVGSPKTDVMHARLHAINPHVTIHTLPVFYSKDSAGQVFAERPDHVIDAIDSVGSKCHLLNHCRSNGIPVVSSCGSGGRLDPTRVRVADLSETQHDALASAVRKTLRREYDYPDAGKGIFGIPAVFSTEPLRMPLPLAYDEGKGFRCVCDSKIEVFNCESRNVIMGTSCAVTGAFGFACASVVLQALLEQRA